MGIYDLILNNLYSNDNVTSTNSRIKPDNIDILLTVLSDVYVTILDNGPIAVKDENIHLNSEHTKNFFITGLTGHKQAMLPSTLKFLMDFLFVQKSRENNISMEELFEMYLIANILPNLLPDRDCIKKFVDYLVEFCTSKSQHYQIVKFVKYIDAYKITDSCLLETARFVETKKRLEPEHPPM